MINQLNLPQALLRSNNPLQKNTVVTFQNNTNPFFKTTLSFNGYNVIWAKDSELGQVKFSSNPGRVNNPNVKGFKVKEITTDKDSIKFYTDNTDKPFAEVKISKDQYKDNIQVGYQDNKGGFALKIWDKKTGTSYVLFDNDDKSQSIVSNGKFQASVNKSSQLLSFTSVQKISNKISNEKPANNINDPIVVGMFGGFGTRMLAASNPTKPATKLGKLSFENYIIENLRNNGIKNVSCSLYNQAESAEKDILSVNRPDMNIDFYKEDDSSGKMGTAGAVRRTIELVIVDRIANLIYGKNPEEAESILKDELGESLSKEIIRKTDKSGKDINKQLKRLALSDLELRSKIFDKEIHKIPYIGVVSGDHITDINFSEFIKKHEETKSLFTIAVKEIDNDLRAQGGEKCPYGCAVMSTDEADKIESFKEKPLWCEIPAGCDKYKINTGIYILSPEIAKEIPSEKEIQEEKVRNGKKPSDDGEGTDFGKDIIPKMLNSLHAYSFNKHWVDVGNNKALQDEVNYLVGDIAKNNGKSDLLPDQEFNTKGNAAISKKANVPINPNLNDNAHLLVCDNAIVGKINVEGTVYIGPNTTVLGGTYQNVWIDKLAKPLLKEKLDFIG